MAVLVSVCDSLHFSRVSCPVVVVAVSDECGGRLLHGFCITALMKHDCVRPAAYVPAAYLSAAYLPASECSMICFIHMLLTTSNILV